MNKKLFLKWLKKSRRNKYNIVHSGGTIEAVISAGATLGDVAFKLASNPVVISAVVGLGVGSFAFTTLVSGGATLVLILVATFAFIKIRSMYSKYYTMIYVMNDYVLLLKKIDTMVRLAVKISQEYNFVIDTKDVNKSLERIFSIFNTLLSDKDVIEINNDVLNSKGGNDELNNIAVAVAVDVDNTTDDSLYLKDVQQDTQVIEVPETVKEKQKNIFQKIASKFKTVKKVFSLNSKKFTEELNEEVTRLGLYFSILLGEFNIILNVCQMDIISKGNSKNLVSKNNSIKGDENFNNLLISSIIYRTLQLNNIFNLCDTVSSTSDTAKKTCTSDNMNEYIKEINLERANIRKVLFGVSKSNTKILFPLYAQLRDSKNTNDALQQLRTIMRGFREPIIGKEQAKDFLKKIHDFNDNYSKKSKSKSDRSTINIIPYDEDDEYGYTDEKNLPPQKPPPPPPQKPPIVNPVAAN
jgi:hypothetical protein